MNGSTNPLLNINPDSHDSAAEPEFHHPGERGNSPISGRRRMMAALLTFVWVPIVGILLLEVVFALFVEVTDMRFNFWDPLLGPRTIPNQSGRFIQGNEIKSRFHFNAQGWNHPEDYVIAKEPGSVRIGLVGDSMVEALQVDPEQSMTVLAAQRMNLPERPAQWYSFGLSGWGTTNEYQVIRHYVLDYQPDLVILMFVQNDPRDNSPYLTIIPSYEPKLLLSDNGELRYEAAAYMPPAWRGRLAGRSALFRYFAIQNGLWARLKGGATRKEFVFVRGDRESAGTEPRAEQGKKTWFLIEKTLEAIRDECQRRGAVFVVAYRGHNGYLDALVGGETYTAPPKEVDPYSLRERNNEMGKEFVEPITRRLEIPYLDLTETLATMIAEYGVSHHPVGDSHYNERAHAAVAVAMSSWAETLLDLNPKE